MQIILYIYSLYYMHICYFVYNISVFYTLVVHYSEKRKIMN